MTVAMTVRLQSVRRLRGTVQVPGDKSISHRAVLLNGLAQGAACVRGFLPSADTLCSLAGMEALGVQCERGADPTTLVVHGAGRRALREAAGPLDCGNSGTTMRLLAGVAAGIDGLTVLDGDASLRLRPMDRVLGPLAQMGARVDGRAGGSLPPITVRGPSGHPLRPFAGRVPVASAQVKSAILLAALAADGVTELEEIVATRDHTETMLAAMGADLRRDGLRLRLTPPPGDLTAIDVDVPGDLSAAAFWLVAGSILPDSEIELPAVGINPTRAGVLEILRSMGADIVAQNHRRVAGEPVADLVVRSAALRGTTIAGDLVPRAIDELPVLAAAAALAHGPTEIREAAELRLKESDRIAATAAGLRAFGAEVEERPDGLRIAGGATLRGARADSLGDHRLAMTFTVLALAAAGPSEIVGAEAVAVSYPTFWQHLEALAGLRAFA